MPGLSVTFPPARLLRPCRRRDGAAPVPRRAAMPLEALIIGRETPTEGIRMDAASPTANLELHVRAAAQGDAEAFARLVDASRTLVCSIALAILRDVEASQDVAQDVFLAAWRDLGKLRNPASFLPWLRQMTRNRAHHVLR